MQFSMLTTMVPGPTLAAQCETIAATGCRGVESIIFPTMNLEQRQTELRQAADNADLALVAVVVGGLALYQPDQIGWLTEACQAIAELDTAVLLTAEYRPQDPLPLFPPFPAPPPAEQAQVDRAVDELARLASTLDVPIYLEPITQFESRFWRDVATVLAICQQQDHPNIRLCLDFHNMNITEAGIEAGIEQAGPWIGHVHLADNNRRLPGQGHIDFAAGLAALQRIGYTGWYTFECGVSDPFVPQVQQAIAFIECQQQGGETM